MFSHPDHHLAPHQSFALICAAVTIVTGAGLFGARASLGMQPPVSPVPVATSEVDPLAAYANWKRPDGPLRVGLQAGHWKSGEAPLELDAIRGRGAYGGGKEEWEVNLDIATRTAAILEKKGVVVDILPAVVPPEYWADAFVTIHADQSPNRATSGYKVAHSEFDPTEDADWLAELIETAYGEATGMQRNGNVTEDMTAYYAFNWQKYEHSIHPMTPAAILETGFLTSAKDRRIIVQKPSVSAQALAEALLHFLDTVETAQ